MTPERWQQIDDLLQQVIDLSAAERTALLDEVCAQDMELREEVETLISFQERAQGFLETPALDGAAYLLCDDEDDSMEGLVIGRYHIGVPIGAGGMGRVYQAEDTNLDIKVAIKFLPWYLEADKQAKQRLVREAKAAAQLDHPNICSVYEVKEEVDQSFIVMQLVAGETLADKIKTAPMTLNQTLNVTIQVVEALAEAHSRGIVHRDIKPGNIMITPRGHVRVLDFGLAKNVGPAPEICGRAEGFGMLSWAGDRSGTPPYMSPEQANGSIVDERADLFAVGVVLYECIAGRRPFVGETGDEILERVTNFDPPPPSAFDQPVSATVNALVLKALAKDLSARYQSAGELLADLRNVQAALEASRRMTISEWIRLNLWQIVRRPRVIAATVAAALVLGLVAYLMTRPTPPHRPPPEALRSYDAGTAALHNGAYSEAAKALKQAIAADDKFALAYARLAEAYTELGYVDNAKNEIIRAQALARRVPAWPSDGIYLEAVANTVLRDFPHAIENYQETLRQSSLQQRANVYLDLGRAYEKNDQLEKAKESYQEAIKLAPQEAAAFLRLGAVCDELEDFACATDAFDRAESQYRNLNNDEGVPEVLYARGRLFLDEVKPPEASVQFENALQMTNKTGNRSQQVRVLQELSSAYALEGQLSKAKQQAADAVQIARDNGIEDQAAAGLIRLGDALLVPGDYDGAEENYQRALEIAERDKLRVDEMWARRQLGSLRSLQHRTDDALAYILPALTFYQKNAYHKWLSLTLTLLGRTYRDKGDYENSLKAFTELVQLGEQLGDRSQVGLAKVDTGTVLSFEEKYPEALHSFEEGYGIFKSLDARVYMAYAAKSKASVLWQMGRFDDTQPMLVEATSIAESDRGNYKQLLADIYLVGAQTDLSQWHLAPSAVKSSQALDLAGKAYPDITIVAEYTLGLAKARSGAPRPARLLCDKALALARTTGDPQLVSGALLASAEAQLASGTPKLAVETARQAQESFAHFDKQDSEWRAWLIAAQAIERLGSENQAREYAEHARAQLASFAQKWAPEDFNRYLARPDIARFRAQLDRLPQN